MDSKKKKKGEEELVSQGLKSIPASLEVAKLTALTLDGNQLNHQHLDLLFDQSPRFAPLTSPPHPW